MMLSERKIDVVAYTMRSENIGIWQRHTLEHMYLP